MALIDKKIGLDVGLENFEEDELFKYEAVKEAVTKITARVMYAFRYENNKTMEHIMLSNIRVTFGNFNIDKEARELCNKWDNSFRKSYGFEEFN